MLHDFPMLQRLKRSSFIHSLALPTLLALCAANFAHAQASAPDSEAVAVIAPVAEASGLGFIPIAEEHYNFACRAADADGRTLSQFRTALASDDVRAGLRLMGFGPAGFAPL